MVLYLPIAFIKDWFYNFLKHRSSRSGKNAESSGDEFSVRSSSPLNGNGVQNDFEMELGNVVRKDSDLDLSTLGEIAPLVAKYNETSLAKEEKELTTKEIATYGFYIAPIWFITEVSNSRLRHVYLCYLFWYMTSYRKCNGVILLLYLSLSVSIKCCSCTY